MIPHFEAENSSGENKSAAWITTGYISDSPPRHSLPFFIQWEIPQWMLIRGNRSLNSNLFVYRHFDVMSISQYSGSGRVEAVTVHYQIFFLPLQPIEDT